MQERDLINKQRRVSKKKEKEVEGDDEDVKGKICSKLGTQILKWKAIWGRYGNLPLVQTQPEFKCKKTERRKDV